MKKIKMKKLKLVLKWLLGFLLFTFGWWVLIAIIMFCDQGTYDASNFITIFITIAVSALKGVFIFYGVVLSMLCLISLFVIGVQLMVSEL